MRLMEPQALWLEMASEIIMQQYERERLSLRLEHVFNPWLEGAGPR